MADCTFWLEIFTCSSRAFSCGSLNIVHHLPWRTLSCGCATFQPSVLLKSAGVNSLKAAGAGAAGRWYLGPTTQPPSANAASRTEAIKTCDGRGALSLEKTSKF